MSKCSKIYYCIVSRCNNEISYENHRSGQSRCETCAGKIHSKRQRGKNNSFFGKHHTKETKEKMRQKAKLISNKRRIEMGIASKKRWLNPILRERMLKNMFKSRQLKPNKCEKQLNNLLQQTLPKKYKFVGDGKVFIDGLCPDFINSNGQKKIIELFGNYWHNLEKTKKRDERRIKTYTKYGYKTLIIWEKELKNLGKLKDRILKFNKFKNLCTCALNTDV